MISYIGTERNILNEAPENCHTLKIPHPILTNRDLEKLRRISSGDLLATTLPTLFRAEDGEEGLKHALDDLSARAAYAVKSGYTLLILSDRGVNETCLLYTSIGRLHAAPGLAGLTTLGVVLELLVLEEELFAGGEDEFAAAIGAG